jgi:hypothetical protein
MTEIYISVDIEADGPIPGPNSMLQLGACAFTADGQILGDFEVNFETLAGATPDADTMKWWAQNQKAYDQTRVNTKHPKAAMEEFAAWTKKVSGGKRVVFVAYPAGYDFTWVYWYFRYFLGKSPFSFNALDIKTYAMAVLGTDFRDTNKAAFPREWFKDKPHTHCAREDAVGQAHLFLSMLHELHPEKAQPRA